MINSRDINLLRPDVAANCQIWLERCKSAGLNVLVTNTVRDAEYQAYLYGQGRTRPGSIITNSKIPTFHSDKAGLAFDFCKNVKGHEYDDVTFFNKAAAIAKEIGFSWGGDWKSFVDRPHIQWDNYGEWTSPMIRSGKLPPKMPLFVKEKNKVLRYDKAADCPLWAKGTIWKLLERNYLIGDGDKLDLSHDMVRILVILDRAGVFDKDERMT